LVGWLLGLPAGDLDACAVKHRQTRTHAETEGPTEAPQLGGPSRISHLQQHPTVTFNRPQQPTCLRRWSPPAALLLARAPLVPAAPGAGVDAAAAAASPNSSWLSGAGRAAGSDPGRGDGAAALAAAPPSLVAPRKAPLEPAGTDAGVDAALASLARVTERFRAGTTATDLAGSGRLVVAVMAGVLSVTGSATVRSAAAGAAWRCGRLHGCVWRARQVCECL
jgi:hypothetical protein